MLADVVRAYPISIQPGDITFDVAEGETVIAAAWRNHYYWPTICGGRGECTACHLFIEDGSDNAVPPEPTELAMLEGVRARTRSDLPVRLACQLRTTGPMTVKKKAVRRRITE